MEFVEMRDLLCKNFAEWYHQNYYEMPNGDRIHLDKDILSKENKIYSKDTCLLVPQRINMIFMRSRNKRIIDTDLPIGIKRTKDGKRYSVMYNTKNLGVHDTVEECRKLYEEEKRKNIQNVANEYKDNIPYKVYDSLMNW